ncbi:MAG: DUF58 domain-containing protein [Steroidobacteraceae bacterium]|nr:DUF58 domain-containing protein [Steroidobacteraceae bacterium]
MAPRDLNPLPAQGELQSFARAAAHLLVEHPTPAPGARTVKRRAGVGLQYLDHRDYVPGDEVRHIDWRLTARLRRPIVRRFEAETSGDWFLMLDASSSMTTGGANKWHAAVLASAAMSFALLELGHRVALVAFADDVLAMCAPGRGFGHYPAIARTLRGLAPPSQGGRSHLSACVRRLRGTTSAFVVSDFLGPAELRPDLAELRERCVRLHALLVHDPRELNLDGAGPVELYDVESGDNITSETGTQVGTLAVAAHAARVRRLQRFATRSTVAFSAWDVTGAWQRALIEHLAGTRAA